MPTYDYTCTKCGHDWEVFQSMKDEPLKTCPDCKKRSAKRLVGAGAGLIFKGTGFYITDYKNKPRGGEGAKTEGTKTEGAKTPAKTEGGKSTQAAGKSNT
tara:strand:+ start:3000 stop:3299 length:300 start_codon:yes stop_codon:yes gene_type:complete